MITSSRNVRNFVLKADNCENEAGIELGNVSSVSNSCCYIVMAATPTLTAHFISKKKEIGIQMPTCPPKHKPSKT